MANYYLYFLFYYLQYCLNLTFYILFSIFDYNIPTQASRRSAGLDLYSSIDAHIEINSIKKFNTRICVSLMDLLEINLLWQLKDY